MRGEIRDLRHIADPGERGSEYLLLDDPVEAKRFAEWKAAGGVTFKEWVIFNGGSWPLKKKPPRSAWFKWLDEASSYPAGGFPVKTKGEKKMSVADANESQTKLRATEGEWRVGLDFNPSGDPQVKAIKVKTAELIDMMLTFAGNRDHPGARNAAIAASQYEDAAMNAVKAVTKKAR